MDGKLGTYLREVLTSKHPAPVEPHMHTLKIYTTILELATLDITIDTVEKVPRKISGAACPGYADAVDISH